MLWQLFARAAAGLGLLAVLAVVSCARMRSEASPQAAGPKNPVRVFQVRGEVKEIHPEAPGAVIRHEEIPGYMPAMTMWFDVKDPAELTGLQPGDQVTFRLVVTEQDGWVEGLTKTGTAAAPSPRTPHVRVVREVEPLEVGDLMPDYRFTNELGRAISLREFSGRAYALTFIFTRCPFPNFCPRMTHHFAEAARLLRERPGAPTNWHLFSISFDVDFDTPERLHAYAKLHRYDPAHWSFLTGAIIDIDAITEQFGLMFTRDESGVNFSHTLRTVVVDAAGRVQRIFIGNEWPAEELAEELLRAAQARPPEAARPDASAPTNGP
jgi:protein SCO1/2